MRMSYMITVSIIIASLLSIGVCAEEAPQALIEQANSALVKLGEDPVIVSAVKAQNARGMTLDQIKTADKTWIDTPGVDDTMKALIESAAGKQITGWKSTYPYIAEAFVMDNKGANVAMSDKTSDYWQGDEDKFTKSFNGGNGAVFIGDVKFDDSAQVYTVQVSVPVKEGSTTIGAVCIGIDLDKFE